MRKKRRTGDTTTFSVSVDRRTKALLKARANRLHGGNVSALIAELGREAERRDAFEQIREWSGLVLTDEDRNAIDSELHEGWQHARNHAKKAGRKGAA